MIEGEEAEAALVLQCSFRRSAAQRLFQRAKVKLKFAHHGQRGIFASAKAVAHEAKSKWLHVKFDVTAGGVDLGTALIARTRAINKEQEAVFAAVKANHITVEHDGTEDFLDDIPIWEQGNLDLYTKDVLAQRHALKVHPAIVSCMDSFWSVDGMDKKAEQGQPLSLTKSGYEEMMLRFYKVLLGSDDEEAGMKSIQEDWERDTLGKGWLGRGCFNKAMFELVDMWCEGVDVEEYTTFLTTMLEAVADQSEDDGSLTFKTLTDVEQVDMVSHTYKQITYDRISPM